MEMADFLHVLSQALPSLAFTLATLCLDSSTIEAYRLQGGKNRKWELPERRRVFHRSRAHLKFGLAADDYSDPEAESWAEDEMLHEALTHWGKADGPEHARRRGCASQLLLRQKLFQVPSRLSTGSGECRAHPDSRARGETRPRQ